MTYNPEEHHRRSIRLRGYDYAQAGFYFISICTQDRACLFGEIVGSVMTPNLAGIVVDQWWQFLPERFPGTAVDAFSLMPNHIHGIIGLGTGDGNANTASMAKLVQWFKSMTTADYRNGVATFGWPPFNGRLWQRNYYEHVIRTEAALDRIRSYIAANPANWADDPDHPVRADTRTLTARS